jgi:hypothetical protein
MTDKKPPQSRKLVAQKVGPVDKRHRPRGLTRAVRTAVDAIIHDRCTRAEACERASISERALYLGLQKREVARYWNEAVVVLRNAERAANIFALIEVRDGKDHSNPMARVTAAKALEQVPEHEAAAARGAQALPGLQIVIVQGGAAMRTIGPEPTLIDVTPVPAQAPIIEHEDSSAEPYSKSAKTW